MKLKYTLSIILCSIAFTTIVAQTPCSFPSNEVVPSANQIKYQKLGIVGFIHFTITTFYDREWGLGNEDVRRFNPSKLNAEQWVVAAKEGGIKELILTTKHHDGFCLWPSKYTKHSVKYSAYKNGKGDIVKEFVEACRKHNLKVGFYLSPWDRNHQDYGKPAYITYYKNQLKELLTNYGEVNEIWFDGANGGDGYYGGANEKRIIDRNTYYPWKEIQDIVHQLQPNCMIFSDAGPDLRWVGNENGFCGETFWSTIDASKLVIGGSDEKYLNVGEPNGKNWIVGQCDVSIRPGWFYHTSQDEKVKTPQKLEDIYYKSVGRNGVMLLNLPPDTTGLIHAKDIENLRQFKQNLDKNFSRNLMIGAKAEANSIYENSECFSPEKLIDADEDSFWAAKTNEASLIITLPNETNFNTIMLQEPIKFGQRVSKFKVEAWVNNEWKQIAEATTIGYKRILPIDETITNKLKISILESVNVPAISTIAIYKTATEN